MRIALIVTCVLASAAWSGNDGDTQLLQAVRKGDTAAVKALLGTGASVNCHDDTGATALMFASAFGSLDTMRLLLERGADVNAANQVHGTALMWAIAEPEKVRLLLDKGANINATTDDGQSALLLAARHPDDIETVRLLLSHGADAKAVDKGGFGLLAAAYGTPDPALLNAAHAAGLKLAKLEQLGPNPLLTALGSRDSARTEEVMKLGADVNERVTVASASLPVLNVLAYAGAVPVVDMLMAHGADPNSKSDRGFTPLMMAAGADHQEPAMVRLLLQKGATVNAMDNKGRTALDWALAQGETETVRILHDAGAKSMANPPAPPPAVATPRTARAALVALMPRLQPISPPFFENFGCISCHNQSLPSITMNHASKHAMPVDGTLAAHPVKATLDSWTSLRDVAIQGNTENFGGFVANLSYGLFDLAENGVAPNSVTNALSLGLARAQAEDGSWVQLDFRPPLGGSPILFTALVLHGVSIYLPEGRREEWKARADRGREFLRKAQPADTQDAAFLLLGMSWAGGSKEEVQRLRDRLLTLQRADGGWGQKPSMPPDAYATGQALHALCVAGVPSSHAAYRKGVQYLLRTQRADGSWFLRTRAFAFQPNFDAGFPHDDSQFISAAASSWAALALDDSLGAAKAPKP